MSVRLSLSHNVEWGRVTPLNEKKREPTETVLFMCLNYVWINAGWFYITCMLKKLDFMEILTGEFKVKNIFAG